MPTLKKPFSQLKITFLTAETYPSYAGGGLNAFNFARYLYRKGADCSIGCLNYNLSLNQSDLIDGVQIRRIPYFNRNMLFKFLSIPLLFTGIIKQIMRSDIVFVYGKYLPCTWFIFYLVKFLGKCLVFRSTMMGEDDLKSLTSGRLGRLKRRLLNKIDLYFAINNVFKEIGISILNSEEKVFTSYQGIDSEYLLPSKKLEQAQTSNKIKIICNGLLVERKGYRGIFTALANANFDFELTILGQHKLTKYHRSSTSEINEMKELFKLGNELLKNRVIFKNTVKDIKPYLHKADIFLYAANQDGTPNAVLEAMAANIPIVMFNHLPDTEIFIPDKTITVFNRYEEIPVIIKELWGNKDEMRKMADYASQIIHKNYTFDLVAKGLFQQLNCKKLKKY